MRVFGVLVAALAIAQPQIAPQRKTVLPNGVVLFVERMDRANGFTLHLFVSAHGAPEREGQRGFRHLVEHIAARGTNQDLDARLEARGLSLTADTLHDGIRFEIEGKSSESGLAIEAAKDLLVFPTVSPAEVARELTIVSEERAVRTYGPALFASLWETGFGPSAPDPMGVDADMAQATPASLASVHGDLFRPDSMVVAIVGDVDLVQTNEKLTAVFAALPSKGRPQRTERELSRPQREGFLSSSHGTGRGASVGSMSQPETMATLAAGFALSSEMNGARLMYSPSPVGGLVCVVHPSRSGLDDLDRLLSNEGSRLYATGVATLRLWTETVDRTPREKARMYGQMLSLEGFFRVDDLRRRATEVSRADFEAALPKFHSQRSVRTGGVR